MKRTVALLALTALTAIFAGSLSAATSKSASLQITHFVHGCHNWSSTGGPYTVNQAVHLARGSSIVVTNNDLMVQDLVKTSGPAVQMKLIRQSQTGAMHMTMPMNGKPTPYAMTHMGAQLRVSFPTKGTYHFKLVDRGDYMDNIKTVGPDNHPTLTVTVT